MNSPVALVTGASRGIGRAVCLAFGALGHTVVAAARDAKALAETMRLVREAGAADSTAVTCDVRETTSIENMVRTVIARHGRIDILVNNAGGGTSARPMTSDETPDTDWLETLDLNLTSVFRACKAVTPHMKSRRSGADRHGGVDRVAPGEQSFRHRVHRGEIRSRGSQPAPRKGWARSGSASTRWRRVSSPPSACRRSSKPIPKRSVPRSAREFRWAASAPSTKSLRSSRFLASPAASYVHGALVDINGGMYMA